MSLSLYGLPLLRNPTDLPGYIAKDAQIDIVAFKSILLGVFMDMFIFLLKGFLIGLSIAAPIGPMGLLVINRTIAGGWSYGAATGMGAALADSIYGLVAALGLTAISDFLLGQKHIIALGGGAFLCWLAISTFKKGPIAIAGNSIVRESSFKALASAFVLCLTSPMTILSFVAIFAGAGLVTSEADVLSGIAMALGVFVGAAVWHVILLSGAISLTRSKLSTTHMLWINRVSAVMLLGFGCYSLFNAAKVITVVA